MNDSHLNAYKTFLENDYVRWDNEKHPDWYVISFEPGSKYIKVVMRHCEQNSVHSFIVKKDTGKFKMGDILKAASWKAPATNFARGNVMDVNSYKNVRWTGC